MKRHNFFLLIFNCLAFQNSILFAQDTIPTYNLDEVVIEASKVIKKIDRDLYFPTAESKKLSSNGLQLLNNLSVPTLMVNDVMGSITSLGNTVQVRVNGRVATVNELKQINPDDIKRVEWISRPGLKYNGAFAVVNVITRNPTVGGSLMLSGMQSLDLPWGQYQGTLKLNNGRSQWGINIFENLTTRIKGYREYNETFTYPDGEKISREEEPLGGAITNNQTEMNIYYNYTKTDTTVFHVQLSGLKRWNYSEDYYGVMTIFDSYSKLSLHDKTSMEGLTPRLNVYLEQHFGKGQTLSVDASASHYDGYSRHLYTESPYNMNEDFTTEINTSIHDRNTSFGINLNYEKEWKKAKLTAGALYEGSRNKSIYEQLNNRVFHQSQNRVRFFGELMYNIKKVSITGGLGVQYSTYRFKENKMGQSSWDLRPQVSIYYTPTQVSWWWLNFTTRQTTPNLNQISEVPRQIDGILWEVGNPELKTYNSFKLQLQYGYSKNLLSFQIGIYGVTEPKVIAPFYEWEGDRLISTYENSRVRQQFGASFSPTLDIVPGWLTISGTLQWDHTKTKGTGYNLNRNYLSGDAQASLYHWNFQLIVMYQYPMKELIGEKETYGEQVSMITLAYNWKKWQFGFGVMCPFNRYEQGGSLLNKYYTYEKKMRVKSFNPMPFIQVSYNLRWGKQKRGVNKRVQSNSETEQSEAGSR